MEGIGINGSNGLCERQFGCVIFCIKKLPSIARIDGSDGLMEGEHLPLQHIIDNPLNVQRNNRPASFIGFQEEAVVGIVVEEILRQGCCTKRILQDVEVALPVWISVGIVLPELVPGKPERCGPVQAIGKPVAGRLATGGVAGPAAGVHPLFAVACGVGVDGDQADIAFAQLPAPGVHSLGADPE